jgi:hypothetical protein
MPIVAESTERSERHSRFGFLFYLTVSWLHFGMFSPPADDDQSACDFNYSSYTILPVVEPFFLSNRHCTGIISYPGLQYTAVLELYTTAQVLYSDRD